MAFTTDELANIANASLDFYIKGQPLSQVIQEKPLLKALEGTKKKFPGGKGNIDMSVKGKYNSYMGGYTHDDTVTYQNPANIKRCYYPWREVHGGLSLTHTELKHDGISVVDTDGKSTSKHSQREKTALVGLLEDKLEDMSEGIAKDMNEYFWGDGTTDAKGPMGVRAFILDDPTTGITGGIDRSTNTWWRNRYSLGLSGASTGTIPLTLKKEWRQLTRFGGKPRLWLAGSAFIEALEAQLYAKGSFSMTGFASNGKNDMGIADISFNGIRIIYDPTLDDLSLSKYLYVIDARRLHLRVMEGEDMKKHNPARPAEKYVLYRGVTWTGQMTCNQMNCHGVYSIA